MNSPHCLGPVWARAYKYAIRRVGKWKMQLLDPWMFIFYIMTGITLDKQFICKVTQNPPPTTYSIVGRYLKCLASSYVCTYVYMLRAHMNKKKV